MNIGHGVRAMMALRRISAEELGNKVGLTRQAIDYRLRQEDWKYQELSRVAEAIGVTADDILDIARKA